MRRFGLLMIAVVLLTSGCALFRRPLDVSGRWSGEWIGYGILDIPRNEAARVELTQQGRRGNGRIILDWTGAAESVPLALRLAGAYGVRVHYTVSGTSVTMRHERGDDSFVADFRLDGDRLVGRIRNAHPSVRIVLHRVKPGAGSSAASSTSAASTSVAGVPPLQPLPPLPPPGAIEPAMPPAQRAPGEPDPSKPGEVAGVPGSSSTPTAPAEATRPAPREFAALPEVRTMHFDFNKADVRPGDAKILEANVDWLLTNANTLVLIEGHADERGTNEYNLALGERRARAARDYLVRRGVQADRISVLSYGEEAPVCRERTEACYNENRRADFLIKSR